MYEVDNVQLDLKPSKNLKLRYCTRDDFAFVAEEALYYYPNSVCFEDKNKVKLLSNWFSNNFSNIAVSIDACDNSLWKTTIPCKN